MLQPIFQGIGDHHDSSFDSTKRTFDFSDLYLNRTLTRSLDGSCPFYLDVYSTTEFEKTYKSNLALTFLLVICSLYILIIYIFLKYDQFVQLRTKKVAGLTARSNQIVSSLFPSSVKERLYQEKTEEQFYKSSSHGNGSIMSMSFGQSKHSLKGFLAGDTMIPSNNDVLECDENDMYKTKPIADLFPEVTVLFADIVGKLYLQKNVLYLVSYTLTLLIFIL